MKMVRILAVLLAPLLPAAALAAGAHDTLDCTGCHSIHDAKDGTVIFAVEANKKVQNPRTKQAVTGLTALCLGCHDSIVTQHKGHPFGLASVNPKVATVPAEGLRDGKFECIGCHDPHPSNPNYKYLRVDTQGGKNVTKFCAACHSSKTDLRTQVAFFSSMDERAPRHAAAAEAAPAAAPAKKK